MPYNPTRAWAEATDPLNDEGIAELVRIAESELGNEQGRGQQLDGKTGSFAAFGGLLLTVDIAFTRSVFGIRLGGFGNIVARAGLITASVALLVGTVLALYGVIMPKRYATLMQAELQEFLGPEKQSTRRREIQRAWLQSIAMLLAQNRPVNDCKVKVIKIIGSLIIVSLIGLTTAGVTLGIHSLAPHRPNEHQAADGRKSAKRSVTTTGTTGAATTLTSASTTSASNDRSH